MKQLLYLTVIMAFMATSVSNATADVNEEITFTNYTDEEIWVELAIIDDTGWTFYDLYVTENGSSIANFWADTIFATYSACAYGEATDTYYGCIEGRISDHLNYIYFDETRHPYKSDPPDQDADLYFFDSPYDTPDVVVIETDDHYHERSGGCFIGAIGLLD